MKHGRVLLGIVSFLVVLACVGASVPAVRRRLVVVRLAVERSWRPLVNLLVIAGAVFLTWHFFNRSQKAKTFTDYLRSRVKRSAIVEPLSVEELMVASGGYGVVRAEIRADWPMVGRTLAKSGLRQKDITILVVRRGDEPIANPPPDTRIQSGDRLLCFGKLDQLRKEFGAIETASRDAESASK